MLLLLEAIACCYLAYDDPYIGVDGFPMFQHSPNDTSAKL